MGGEDAFFHGFPLSLLQKTSPKPAKWCPWAGFELLLGWKGWCCSPRILPSREGEFLGCSCPGSNYGCSEPRSSPGGIHTTQPCLAWPPPGAGRGAAPGGRGFRSRNAFLFPLDKCCGFPLAPAQLRSPVAAAQLGWILLPGEGAGPACSSGQAWGGSPWG